MLVMIGMQLVLHRVTRHRMLQRRVPVLLGGLVLLRSARVRLVFSVDGCDALGGRALGGG